MPPKAVILDIGNVLIEWHPESFFAREIGADRTAAFFEEVGIAEMNLRSDRGENFHRVLAETRAAHPAWAAELDLWREEQVCVELLSWRERERERNNTQKNKGRKVLSSR